jgi:hypothetical protein
MLNEPPPARSRDRVELRFTIVIGDSPFRRYPAPLVQPHK